MRRLTLTTLLIAAALLAGCGGGGRTSGLVWEDEPFEPLRARPSKLLPDDLVVIGTVRNNSLRRMQVLARKVRLLDAAGRPVKGVVAFTHTPGHGLYAERRPHPVLASELARTGRLLVLPPGKTSPLTVAWRQPAGARRPVAIDYGSGRLELP